MKLYKVFTAGKYPQGDVTVEDLKQIADGYDPDFHEAPLTLNHKSEGPAMGWVSNVVAKGRDLFVGFKSISEDARKITGKGEYKRPSIEISNYEGKGKYLRAVSLVLFPAVKGLPEMQFKTADGEAVIYFSEGEINLNTNKNNNNMELIQKFSEMLGLNEEEATMEDVVNGLNDKYEEQLNNNTSLLNEVNALKAEVKKFGESQVDILISSALSSGKIVKAQEESIKKFADTDFEACKSFIDSLPVKSIYQNGQTKTKTVATSPVLKYEDILKDPTLADQYTEEELQEARKRYLK